MGLRIPKGETDEADLDVTPFMNLMIVLVPVLLLSMTFTKVTVLELALPELTGGAVAGATSQSKLEVVVNPAGIQVFFPENTLIQDIPQITNENGDAVYDFHSLSLVLQAVKNSHEDKKDVVILLDKNTGYQDIVKTMDTVKSFKAVVVSSMVEIELFPEISLGEEKS